MKKYLSVILLVFVFSFTFILEGCSDSNLYNCLNTSECYVQVLDAIENKSEGKTTYDYNLTGYDKDGNPKDVKLNESKRLRKNAYLRVKLKANNEVMRWSEVQVNDLPEKVKEKFHLK